MPISTVEELRKKLNELATHCLDNHTGEDKNNSLAAMVKALLGDPLVPLERVTTLASAKDITQLKDDEKELVNMLKPNEGFNIGVIPAAEFQGLINQDKEAIKLTNQFNRFTDPVVNDTTIFGLEAVRVTVELKKLSQTTENKKLNIFVIDTLNDGPQKESLQSCINELLKQVPEEGAQRAQIIIKSGMHFTTIDLNLEKNNCQCLIMDATNDPAQATYAAVLSKIDELKAIYLMQRLNNYALQKDGKSCAIFALDHTFSLTELPNLYEELKQNSGQRGNEQKIINLTWDKLPPILIKNAQSQELLDAYKKSNPQKEDEPLSESDKTTLKEYLHRHCSAKIKEGNKTTFSNDATLSLFESYKKQFEEYMQRHDASAKFLFDVVNSKETYQLAKKVDSTTQLQSHSSYTTTTKARKSYTDAHPKSTHEPEQESTQEQKKEEKTTIEANEILEVEQAKKKQKTDDSDKEETSSSLYKI